MKKTLAAALLFISSAAYATDAFDNSFYMHLGLGERQYPTSSINKQFDTSAAGSSKPDSPDVWAFNGGLALGYQSPAFIGIELGIDLGQGLGSLLGGNSYSGTGYGDFTVKGSTGGTTVKDFSESVSSFNAYVMPALRIPLDGLGGRPSFHTLGLQIASSQLYGSRTKYYTYTSSYYDYYYGTYSYSTSTYSYLESFRSYATTYTLCYRVEQMLSRYFSLGLELNYHWANYPLTDYSGGTVYPLAYEISKKPEDKKQVALDLSGPSIKLSLGIWFLRPFINEADDKRVAKARAERFKQRYSRRRGYNRTVDVSGEMAQRLLSKGDAQMDLKNHAVAVELYREAVATDPTSRWAWQGLGNAQYYLKKYGEALEAYDRAYELSDGDQKLKDQIDKIRAWKSRLPTPPAQ